jgi:hypothetical protein
MIDPMTPVNRDNLSMIGMAGILDKTNCNLDYKPGITVYKFGKDVQLKAQGNTPARGGYKLTGRVRLHAQANTSLLYHLTKPVFQINSFCQIFT